MRAYQNIIYGSLKYRRLMRRTVDRGIRMFAIDPGSDGSLHHHRMSKPQSGQKHYERPMTKCDLYILPNGGLLAAQL